MGSIIHICLHPNGIKAGLNHGVSHLESCRLLTAIWQRSVKHRVKHELKTELTPVMKVC